MQQQQMTPEKLQAHLDAGTFLDLLMQEIEVIPEQVDNELRLKFVFPEWYTEFIAEDSQRAIEAALQKDAQAAWDAS